MVHEPWPVWIGFILAILVSGLCGYIVGKLSFRVRGAYFVIVTISFAEVVRLVALNWVELTQGPLALTSIPPMTLGLPGLGYFDFYSKQSNYYLVLVVVALSYVIISRLVNSRIGRAMVALKENESLAVSVGIDVTRYLVLAAVVSAGIAGAAGSLYAHYLKIIDPGCFPVPLHRDDGDHGDHRRQGHAGGPDRRRPDLRVHSGVARSFASPELQWILYGLFMILIVFVLPQGIVPAIEKWFGVAEEKPRGPGATAAPKMQDAP